jgi:hypothetical protein
VEDLLLGVEGFLLLKMLKLGLEVHQDLGDGEI